MIFLAHRFSCRLLKGKKEKEKEDRVWRGVNDYGESYDFRPVLAHFNALAFWPID